MHRSLEATRAREEESASLPCRQVWCKLDYVPSLLVLEEVYGKPRWNEDEMYKVLGQIVTPEVLQYLFKTQYVANTMENIIICLRHASYSGSEALVRLLIDLFKSKLESDPDLDEWVCREEVEQCMYIAADIGHVSVVSLLDDYLEPEEDEDNELLSTAISGGHDSMVRYALNNRAYEEAEAVQVALELDSELLAIILTHFKLSARYKHSLLGQAIDKGAVNCIKILLKAGARLDMSWSELLSHSISSDNIALTKFVLEQGEDVEITPGMLAQCKLNKNKEEVMKMLLADPRTRSK